MGNTLNHVLAADYGAGSGRVVREVMTVRRLRYRKYIDSVMIPFSLRTDCTGIS